MNTVFNFLSIFLPSRLTTGITTLAITFSVIPSYAALDKDSEGLDYNSIITKFSRPTEVQRFSKDPLEEVKIHLGVGMTTSFFSVDSGQLTKTYVAERGIQASLGIDLLSHYWLAEGIISSYGDAVFDRTAVGLKEFELRTVYRSLTGSSTWGFHIGGGLAARYLRVKQLRNGSDDSYSTPAASAVGGLDIAITDKFTLGAEAIYRNSLIDETPDQTALNMAVRLDGHF